MDIISYFEYYSTNKETNALSFKLKHQVLSDKTIQLLENSKYTCMPNHIYDEDLVQYIYIHVSYQPIDYNEYVTYIGRGLDSTSSPFDHTASRYYKCRLEIGTDTYHMIFSRDMFLEFITSFGDNLVLITSNKGDKVVYKDGTHYLFIEAVLIEYIEYLKIK